MKVWKELNESERITEVKRLIALDYSTAMVAAELQARGKDGRISRNVVAGWCARRGIAFPKKVRRKKTAKPKYKPKPKLVSVKGSIKKRPADKPKQFKKTKTAIVSPAPVDILDVKDGDCRFPLWGNKPPYLFCGNAVEENKIYCKGHNKIATKTILKRKTK